MDRTLEFNTVAENARLKGNATSRAVVRRPSARQQKSQFSLAAGKIGKEIYDTSEKLGKLTMLAKKKTVFDDPAVEIEELTYIIKQSIQNLNREISALRDISRGSSSTQNTAHSDTVVTYLNSKLANTTKDFKDILQVRTEHIKTQQEKRDRLVGRTLSGLSNTPPRTHESVLYKPHLDNLPESPQRTGHEVAIVMPTSSQMMMTMQQEDYTSSRASAVENIERTIAELGDIFTQLAMLVAEQGDKLQRIDDNIEASEVYINEGHGQLMKHLVNISSNRVLIIKLFLILIVFAVIFIVFFV